MTEPLTPEQSACVHALATRETAQRAEYDAGGDVAFVDTGKIVITVAERDALVQIIADLRARLAASEQRAAQWHDDWRIANAALADAQEALAASEQARQMDTEFIEEQAARIERYDEQLRLADEAGARVEQARQQLEADNADIIKENHAISDMVVAERKARQQAEEERDAAVRRCNQHTRQADRDVAEARGQRDDALMRAEQAEAALTALREQQAWRPVADTPPDAPLWWWVIPKPPDEAWQNTSGEPICIRHDGRLHRGRRGSWSALEKATHWMYPIEPAPPREEPQHVCKSPGYSPMADCPACEKREEPR